MDKVKQRAIASKGGKAVQAAGTGHRWNSEEASLAGQIGGGRKKKPQPTDPSDLSRFTDEGNPNGLQD